MTNEEALERIDYARRNCDNDMDCDGNCELCDEAMDMAIQALEKQIKYKWIEAKELPPDGELVLMKGHGHDVIVPKKGETIEQAMERISKIEWCDIGFYSVEDEGWCNADGFPHIIAPEKWKPIDWSDSND